MALTPWFTRPARRPGRSPRKRPGVEVLEAREVPSGATPALATSTLLVRPGDPKAFQTIQAAVNAAAPGDRIAIFGGTYQEAVTVPTAGLTLFGAPGARVVIEPPSGGAVNGITVADPGGATLDGFSLANVAVRGFAGDGVFLNNVSGFSLNKVRARDNGEYGLFPVSSADGSITGCTASGSNDTGIYVGQSSNVLIRGNTAFGNVNGIEIENSTAVTAAANHVHNNTVGILEDLLPGLPALVASGNVIKNNRVFNNNKPNTAPSGDPAALEPPGIGIAVVGGDHTRVQGNTVLGNAFAGIAVLSGTDLLGPYPPGVDPLPENTLVQGNVAVDNGFQAVVPPGFPRPADLLWTGGGTNNHWRNNVFVTSTPPQLP
jgi:parallel beta-helix repeat protein